MGSYSNIIKEHINASITTKQELLSDPYLTEIERIGRLMASAIAEGNKIMFCGNGGSAADSQHLAAELVIRLRGSYERPAIPALALTVDASIMTAGGNDIGFENVFARCVQAYGKKGDILVGISTSGNSPNVLRAFDTAKEMKIDCVAMLGKDGGNMNHINNKIIVPSDNTAHIQESHIMIGHLWCQMIEEIVYPK
jgi:D-sedoheptulose 7-phosphate isomerase